MRALVIGYGSIGSRHARILGELGCQVAVVTTRNTVAAHRFESIDKAIREYNPEYAVVATETARHMSGIAELNASGFRGTLLVEKPLCHNAPKEAIFYDNCFVAYNLRFHPVIQRLQEVLISEKIISVHAYVGQYLPTWRADRDYRTTYSADKQAGGGVLRDLSHELDLLNWLLHGWQKLTALGGHFSHLEIDSDDIFSIMMTTKLCPVVTLEMNYLDQLGRRKMIINTENKTIEADLVSGELLINRSREHFQGERDQSYRNMHQDLIEKRYKTVCTLTEGLEVVKIIAAAEQAAEEGIWVTK